MWTRRNKRLALILLIVAVAIAIDEMTVSKQKTGNLPDYLIDIDSNKIQQIQFYSKNQTDKAITLYKKDSQWFVKSQNNEYPADETKVKNLISKILHLKPTQVVGKSKQDWAKFGTTDTAGITVILKNKKGKQLAKFYIGKIANTQNNQNQFNPYMNNRNFATYVRLDGDKKVYTVNELLALNFINDPNNYRINKFTSFDAADVTRVEIKLPDTSFTLTKQQTWLLNNSPADSLKTEQYLKNINHLYAYDFVSDSVINNSKLIAKIKIALKNGDTIYIHGYGDTTINYIWSSQNPKSYFKANYHKDRLFKHPQYFQK